jgi:hypothetical protein
MYKYELPEELREDVKAVFERNASRLIPSTDDLLYLMNLYYRYCVRLSRGQTVENEVKVGINCSKCKGKVLYYFKNEIRTW